MTKQELEQENKLLRDDLNVLKAFNKSDKNENIILKAENKAYKKQISFYERIIEQLLDKTEY